MEEIAIENFKKWKKQKKKYGQNYYKKLKLE